MTTDPTTDALLAGHALGDLDDAEREQLAQLLEHHPELRHRLDDFRTTLQLLPLALPGPEAPPQHLRNRLLDAFREEGQSVPAPAGGARGRRPSSTAPGWLAPAGLVLMGLVSVVLGLELRQTRLQLAAVQRLTPPLPPLPPLTRPTSHRMPLRAVGSRGMGSGVVVVTGSPDHNLLVLDGLPPPPPDHAYRLWALVNGREVGCVQFLPDADGHVEMRIPVHPTSLASRVSVSVEPLSLHPETPKGTTVMAGPI
jgi:hypothetical protein